jgi:Ankyrin repeats (3 copies)
MLPPPIPQQQRQQPLERKNNHDALMSSCWSLEQTQATRAALLKESAALEETSDTLESDDDCEEYGDSSDEEDEIDEAQDEAETRIAKALAQAAFKRDPQPASAALHRLLQSSWHEVKRQHNQNSPPPRPFKRARSSLQVAVVQSATNNKPQLPITAMVREVASVSMRLSISAPLLVAESIKGCAAVATAKENAIKPDDCLAQLLLASQARASSNNKSIRYHKASELTNFFVPLTTAALEAYTADLTRAVHQQDVTALRLWHEEQQERLGTSSQGHSLWHAGNKFGETIVHAACRRGSTAVLTYLLEHGAPLRVCCDAYRTPLHDACWTSTDQFGPVLDLILDACPDLLYILDARGFTPLQYVPRSQWSLWNDYLVQRGAARLRPTSLDIGV